MFEFGYCYYCRNWYSKLTRSHMCFECNQLLEKYLNNITNNKKHTFIETNNRKENLIQLELFLAKMNDKKTCENTHQFITNLIESIENQPTIHNNNDYRKNFVPQIRTDDGHYVRSKGEQIIDNWLFNNKIRHTYEKQLIINSNTYYPDFYLPDYDKYIEYWGLNTKEYINKKTTKINNYIKNNIDYINIDDKILQNLDDYLNKELIKKGEK